MSKGLFGPQIIVPQTVNNMTGTVVLTSLVMDFRLSRAGSISAIWTGAPRGALSIQGSLDYSIDPGGAVLNPGNWSDLGINITGPSGSAGNALVDISMTGLPWLRLQYTNSSGVGTLVVYGHGKGV